MGQNTSSGDHKPVASDNYHKSKRNRQVTGVQVVDSLSFIQARRLAAADFFESHALDFPFLKDSVTVQYIDGSKVMFIMRGLPGSGKTTIVKYLVSVFSNTVVCSADEHFMRNGIYEFDPSELHIAHSKCQEKAQYACETNQHVVIIDNTNVKAWESAFYCQVANANRYVVVFIEPQTTWKFNPVELAVKNNHQVRTEAIITKLNLWEFIIPFYFGWFLNEADSRVMSLVGLAHLEECFKVPEFAADFQSFSHLSSVKEMIKYFALPHNKQILHCTSKFCNYGQAGGSEAYAMRADVIKSCGQCYELHIIGFVITPRTFGARVKLSKHELTLWGGDHDAVSIPPTPVHVETGTTTSEKLEYTHNRPQYQKAHSEGPAFPSIVKDTLCQASLVCSEKLEPSFKPVSGFGSRAHLTLGCAQGVPAVTTGLDLLEVVVCEADPAIASSSPTFELPRGWLRDYGQGRWVLYLQQQISVKSLFSGFY